MARQPYLEHSKTLERRFICTVRLATLDERHLSFRTLCAMLSSSCHKFGICWDWSFVNYGKQCDLLIAFAVASSSRRLAGPAFLAVPSSSGPLFLR
ncbi:hypothetical protein HETIRDRAFT_321369 [Heterobasidion irregulare TC 32-1]|uniref:Uncharacterized protein n=1 Tax=Heterobasidion irregulare (strain TC 32-1) TaxID=747525 RepID=W4K506_HETIT|nr:uncharacterized protein HETIRDRAFT_321369 [Heterobasidion irregulare TC 32-1]ETW80819.1 hypothetical protein HETIRDRAFT_321369 [Heterobasidion irregulare TC 32-1]